MTQRKLIFGPTFNEMLYPDRIDKKVRQRALKALEEDPLDPINLFNITWKNSNNQIYYMVMPKELTGVEANIIMMYSKNFPTGSHKVGATYSVLMEKQLFREVDIDNDILVWPSTGNYGIGGAWVGCRMNFECVVILPELMSKERFEIIERYGGKVIRTPGCESNVKEIYDKCKKLVATDTRYKILNQFEVMGNYRFHYYVTGNTIVELVRQLKDTGIGNGRCAAYISAMGSAGTIAAGDKIKQEFFESKTIGLEPIQCPTIMMNGFGGHDIQGIGDKHATWIHNIMNMDCMMAVDDMESKKGLQIMIEDIGKEFLIKEVNIDPEKVELLSQIMGISGICNLLGAIKTAKYYDMTSEDNIVTVATDSIDRYWSVMEDLDKKFGKIDKAEAKARFRAIFENVKLDWISEGTYNRRKRWFNLKYYTWVEQQGKEIEELVSQKRQDYWLRQQEKVKEVDQLILKERKKKYEG